MTIMHYGGEGLIQLLRGQGLEGQGRHLPINPEKWNFFFPSAATLRCKVPPFDPYVGIREERIDLLRKAMAKKGSKLCGGLVVDETQIRHGLYYDKNRGCVIGT